MKRKLLTIILGAALLLPAVPAFAAQAQEEAPTALSGLCAGADGAFLATDSYNKVIWRVKDGSAERWAGVVPVAGPGGEPQGVYHDGALDKAYFGQPWGIAAFAEGYAVTDTAAHAVRFVTASGVATLAGSGKAGSADGKGTAAGFDRPTGIASDGNGSLYVADTGNGRIRRVTADGTVSTWAKDLTEPTGLWWSDGALYVAETGRSRILRIREGSTEVLAGTSDAAEEAGEYYGGYADGPAATARFDHPQGVAVGEDGTVYVADTLNHALRMIRSGRVYTLAASADGMAPPTAPRGLLPQGDALYAADLFSGVLGRYTPPTTTYHDVSSGAWYALDAAEATLRGLVNGTGGGAFSPEAAVSRAAFVTMLSRLERSLDGTEIIDGDESFPDVEAESWYGAAARWAAEQGVVNGIDGRFCPEQEISREQIAVMLARRAESLGVSAGGENAARQVSDFADAGEISAWAEAGMAWAVGAGILNGSDGRLRPGDTATRAECVKLLLNFMELCEARRS